MTTSNETDRLERAKRLRQQIEELTQGRRDSGITKEKESAAEFVHRRMQEIDQIEKERSR